MDLIFSAIFGFYFTVIDTFFGSPDSLEAMIVFSLLAFILTGFTVAVPLTFGLGFALFYFGPVIIEALWYIERGIEAVRSVAPFWVWAAVIAAMYPIGILFGEVGSPSSPSTTTLLYTAALASSMLSGIWAGKQTNNTVGAWLLSLFGAAAIVGCLSVPLYSWAVAPGITIMVMFFGLLGCIIRMTIEIRRQPPRHYRCCQ